MLNYDQQYNLGVRDLALVDRPREKLIAHGSFLLNSAELLAIILNTGTKKEEVLTMAKRLLHEYGEKGILSQTKPSELAKEFDIPLVKACQIIACFELGKRFFQNTTQGLAVVRTATQAFSYFKDMENLTKEHLRGIYLDSHYRVIHDEVISVGSLTANIIHPREVFRPAIERSAAALIIAHNHPSGSAEATEADMEITKQLVEAGKILGIDLLDHLIISKNNFTSILNS